MAEQHADQADVVMPLMGEGIIEATLVRWLKRPGDEVKKGEPLLEVSTDKVDTEIPAPASGILREVLAKDGDSVAVNRVIARIGASGAAPAGVPARPSSGSASPPPEPRSGHPGTAQPAAAPVGLALATSVSPIIRSGGVRSSPLVRKMARDRGVDLAQVGGSGLGGRITKRDFEAFLSREGTGSRETPLVATERLATKQVGDRELLDGVPVRRERMSRMRSLIAEHMVRSVRTSPHVTTVFEIDMQRAWDLRERMKDKVKAREGFSLTFTAFFAHAAVQAIKRHPIVNVSVDGDEILWKDQINLGIAVAIETGLIVPVIRDAGELNLLGVARRIHDLATRARTKKLLPEDVQGGTFSITNPGMFGSIVSSPIINQPQVAILSIGAIIKRPVVINDMIAIRPLVQVGLTFDHRVVDGEGGARYLASLKAILESVSDSDL